MTTKFRNARKTTVTEKSAAVRKGSVRKAITTNIRKIERVRNALEKAAKVLEVEASQLKGDTGDQITEVYNTLNLGIGIANGEIESQANELARTFLK